MAGLRRFEPFDPVRQAARTPASGRAGTVADSPDEGKGQGLPDAGTGEHHDEPVDTQTQPAGGGIPYSIALRNASSTCMASGSPWAAFNDWATSRSR